MPTHAPGHVPGSVATGRSGSACYPVAARPQSARPASRSAAPSPPAQLLSTKPLSRPPPAPTLSALGDAVARGCLNAVGHIQTERSSSLLLAPDEPPRSQPRHKMLTPRDTHDLPSPGLGVRASKHLHIHRPARDDPEMLQKLLHLVRTGLRDADPGSIGYVEQRLDVFRRAFTHFIAAYGVYAPLLLGVQEAYEDALAHATAQAEGVEEVAERLALIQDETTQLLDHQKQDAGAEQAVMSRMVKERDERIRSAQKENDKLRGEVRKLSNELEHSRLQREDMDLRNLELSKAVEHWQAETADARRQATGDDNELEKMRRDHKQLAERERMLLEEDKEQRQAFRETRHELETLKASTVPREVHKQTSEALARSQAAAKAAKAEAEELRRLLAGGESHARFPSGLQWADASLDDVAYLDPAWRGKQVHSIIDDLVLDVLTLHREPASIAGQVRQARCLEHRPDAK